MKKHDEGYALVMVLIVMLVLCTVAGSVLAISTGNLQKQQESFKRMEERYEAAGLIEAAVARIKAGLKSLDSNSGFDKTSLIGILADNRVCCTSPIWDEAEECVVVRLEAVSGSTVVVCDLELRCSEGYEITENNGVFIIPGADIEYRSYEVRTVEGGEQ